MSEPTEPTFYYPHNDDTASYQQDNNEAVMSGNVILFYDKCRLCLDKPGVSNVFIHDDMPEKIYECTGVKIKPSDNLPQKICFACTEVVTEASRLRMVALKNDSHLRSLFETDSDDDHLVMDESAMQTPSCSDIDNLTQHPEPEKKSKRKESPVSTTTQSQNCNGSTRKPLISVRSDLLHSPASSTASTKEEKELPDSARASKRLKFESDESGTFHCSVCSKGYETKKKLYLHERSHNKSIVCPLDACGKMFTTKGDLQKHVRVHTGERPFACDVCGKKFTQNGTLRAHKENVHYVFENL